MKLHKKSRIAFFATILAICTACIGITISMEMNKYHEKEIEDQGKLNNTELYEVDLEVFRSKFINSFNNKVTGKYEKIQKTEETKEIIYSNNFKEKIENQYDININIPMININNEDIKKYNEEIKNIFTSKIDEIKKNNVKTIYTIDYMANIKNNILSLAIKATLKEGENSQRLIVKTYNYNLEKEKEADLTDLILKKGLKTKDVENKLKTEITKQSKQALELKELGYDAFIRNITDDMFKTENIDTYFIGEDGEIYVIYAYGNNNLTTEMDIVVF